MTNERFHSLFAGKPRSPESRITKREMDLAASIQQVAEEVMLKLAAEAKRMTGARYLCLAGGIALNCVANGKLLRSGLYDDIWIQPAAGDAGGAVGAALFAEYNYFSGKRHAEKYAARSNCYLGPRYDTNEISEYLESIGAKYTVENNRDKLYRKVAELLNDGKIVGFFNGRMEFGPRALGARSILGDARNPEMQVKLNVKIKFRESFRPFAPAVLAEKAAEYFDIDRESPYMLLVADVKQEHQLPFDMRALLQNTDDNDVFDMLPIVRTPRSDIPAVTHVDYSARLQTVNIKDDPDFHKLITEFYRLTGCPVLVNTSFNVRGEPIVCTPDDAFRCFMCTDMDVLVMEDILLLKDAQPQYDWAVKGGVGYALD